MTSVNKFIVPVLVLSAFQFITTIDRSYADDETDRFAQPLLKPHAIAHEDTQLSEESQLVGYDKIEYVDAFANCSQKVRSSIDKWLKTHHLVSSEENQAKGGRLRVAVPVDSPALGYIILLYRIFEKKKRSQSADPV